MCLLLPIEGILKALQAKNVCPSGSMTPNN